MKKLFLLLFLFASVVASAQKAWTVQTVPNTRRQSNDIHVSDPDGFLSANAEKNINAALCAIRGKADVFVVTLASIGKADSKHFATELFNYWGIGDAKANNGVLLLFVEDQHKLEFETGYGAEKTLTDARCQRIFTQTIRPCFKAGDYEKGICAGVADIVSVYGGSISQELLTALTGNKSSAQTVWTVQTLPNPRLKDNNVHVSDPDGFISIDAETNINKALGSIRDKVDVAVVPLTNIGNADPWQFSDDLVKSWGIGDAATDNGVLILLLKEQDFFNFHVGNGAAMTLNDTVRKRIFVRSMHPYFRVNDIEGGLCAGVAEIVNMYGGEVPQELKTILSSPRNIWTVQTVPNPRTKGNNIHVSNPDGVLSDSVEQVINEALESMRDKADVYLVALATIGRANLGFFANDLFNSWNIGDADTDNGVLLLMVEDQHNYWFKRGFGAEKTLTVPESKRIIKSMKPYFVDRDYDGGFSVGVAEILRAYDCPIPKELKALLPGGGFSILDFNYFSGSVFVVFLFVIPICSFVRWLRHRKDKSVLDVASHEDKQGTVYINGIEPWSGSPWEGQAGLRALTFGLSPFIAFIIAFILVVAIGEGRISEVWKYNWIAVGTMVIYFTFICLVQNIRSLRTAESLAQKWIYPKDIYNRAHSNFQTQLTRLLALWLGIPFHFVSKRKIAESMENRCPTCGEPLKVHHGVHLTDIHALESNLKALSFKPYYCSSGHCFVWQERGPRFPYFCKCEKCDAYTMKQMESQTIREADYSHKGEKIVSYECQNCGETVRKTVVIPKKISNNGYSGNSDSGDGRSSFGGGGSFGGGESGGGGASGDW